MTLSDLKIKLSLAGVDQVRAGLRAVSGDIRGAAETARGAAVSFVGIATTLSSLVSAFSSARAAAIGFQSAVQMDSLQRGLASVSVDAADLTAQMGRLKEVAKLPGLGFEEAVRGSLALQAAGLSAALAERSLGAFGNALATVGRGKSDLDGVTLALQQIAAKGKVSAEEINQINERVPQIRAAMKGAFGTADTEELQKAGIDAQAFITGIVTQLEKLPRVTGGIGNDLENFGDRIKTVFLPLGQGIATAFSAASPGISKVMDLIENRARGVGEVIAAVANSGVLADTIEKIVGALDGALGGNFQTGMVRVIGTIITIVGNLPAVFNQVRTVASAVWDAIGQRAGIVGTFIGQTFMALMSRAQVMGGYLKSVFAVIGENIGKTFSYAVQRGAAIFDWAKGALGAFVSSAGGIFSLLGGDLVKVLPGIGGAFVEVGKHLFNEATKLQIGFLSALEKHIPGAEIAKPNYAALPAFPGAAMDATPFPDFGEMVKKFKAAPPLPKLPNIYKTATNGMAENIARIQAAVGPLADLPDGLNFGGRPAALDVKNDKDGAKATLERIADNTRATADAVSLRRSATGGGPLGQLGVTPAELLGGAAAVYQTRARAAGFVRDSSAQGVGNAVSALVDRRVNIRLATAGGGGYRPR